MIKENNKDRTSSLVYNKDKEYLFKAGKSWFANGKDTQMKVELHSAEQIAKWAAVGLLKKSCISKK